ncbi:MAG: PAS domain-containing protein, partial [Reyranellaceae bacterium]
MSIEAINERLLRSIGVGIAIVDPDALQVLFCNEKFGEWFGTAESGATLEALLPGIDGSALRNGVADGGRYAAELTVKPKRRAYSIALVAHTVSGGARSLLLIECQNVTRMRELEAMIESYSRMVEKNTRELKREKERAEKLLLNIMPRQVYDEFRTFGVTTPQRYDAVSVILL